MHQEHDMRPILKHPLNVRIFHYILLLSFLPLAATGLLLFFKPLSQEGMQLTYDVHIIAGIVMALDAVAFTIMAFDRVVLFIARVFSFSGRDVKWFMVLGGYPQKFLLGKSAYSTDEQIQLRPKTLWCLRTDWRHTINPLRFSAVAHSPCCAAGYSVVFRSSPFSLWPSVNRLLTRAFIPRGVPLR